MKDRRCDRLGHGPGRLAALWGAMLLAAGCGPGTGAGGGGGRSTSGGQPGSGGAQATGGGPTSPGSGGGTGSGGSGTSTGGTTVATGGSSSTGGGAGPGGRAASGGTSSGGGSGDGSGGTAGGTGVAGRGGGGAGAGGGPGPGDAGTVDAGTDTARDAGGDTGTPPSTYNPCPPAGTECTIMPFGDSITDGFTVRGGYRIPFFQRAHQEGKQFTFVGSATNGPAMVDGVPFPQRHEGHSAYTINNEPSVPRNGIAPLVATVIPRFHPDIVLLMIGTNDVDNSLDLPNLPNRLGALIDSIIALDAHTLIVVAQITPTMQDPLNARIQTYNAAIPAVVKARADAGKHVRLVDMNGAFVKDTAYKSKFLADRLHPNAAGYAVMSDTWNTVVHDLLH
ncbi:MAG: SGNH/GDSL hydrolase family protein [Verrucomicrobiota bacterium]